MWLILIRIVKSSVGVSYRRLLLSWIDEYSLYVYNVLGVESKMFGKVC